MSLTISNNGAVAAASMNLGKNQQNLQKSIQRLSSGKKFAGAAGGDPGSLAVSMRLGAALSRLEGAQSNVANAISFLEYQDGLLETGAKIVARMAELKGLSVSDPLKSEEDIESYLSEFNDLQSQLRELGSSTLNGVSVFAQGAQTFDKASSTGFERITVYTTSQGSAGSAISIHRSMFWGALSVTGTGGSTAYSEAGGTGASGAAIHLAVSNTNTQISSLDNVSLGAINAALDNVIWLRGQTAGGLSRLNFAADSIKTEKMNMGAALSRIEDADIAEESAKLAKYSILMQASAAMISQANQQSQVALTLLR